MNMEDSRGKIAREPHYQAISLDWPYGMRSVVVN